MFFFLNRNGVIELDLTRIANLSVRILQTLIVRAGLDPLSLLDQSVEVNLPRLSKLYTCCMMIRI